MKCFLFTLALLAASGARAAESGDATAAAFSAFTLSGVKSGLASSAALPPEGKACIAALPDSALGATILPLLRRDVALVAMSRSPTCSDSMRSFPAPWDSDTSRRSSLRRKPPGSAPRRSATSR
jgi:hypothetical protein